MPADFAKQVITQLSEIAISDLDKFCLQHGQVYSTSTPRRAVLLIEEIADSAADLIDECKGPPLNQAFKDGYPTKAAIGFAKRCQLDPEDLEIKDTSKGQFVFAKKIKKGKPSFELLSELIPDWIENLQGKRFMRWGDSERRFSRPIRWIVSLLDKELIPIHLSECDPEVHSDKISRGLRFKELNPIITSANDYFDILSEAGVCVNRISRKSLINDLISHKAKFYNAIPDIPLKLLDELTDLVENPSLISGEFDSSFLSLPPEVLSTVMKVHQRYVPLYLIEKKELDPLFLNSNDILLPLFLCISNGMTEANDRIKKGNERVLKARLSDAKFFIKTDLSISSTNRLEQLKQVSFFKGLGSLYDRVKRIEWIVELLINQIEGPKINSNHTIRAASLCKHDLVSQMVGEFPELEGIIGGKYLLHEKEPRDVALAVLEHYLPRGTGDSLPQSDSGSILALAERFELLLSIFSKGDRPTGSSDPYALRRAGNGILQILFSKNWSFNINQFLIQSIKHWDLIFTNFQINQQALLDDLSDFFRQRIISHLEESKLDIDLVQAIAGESIPISRLLSDPVDASLRVNLLASLRTSGKLSPLRSVVTRASRLAENSSLSNDVFETSGVVEPSLFEKNSEIEVLKLINCLEPIVKSKSKDRYILLANELAKGSVVLSKFFDGADSVMVMTDNLSVRKNRLNLLKILKNQSSLLADFNQISR